MRYMKLLLIITVTYLLLGVITSALDIPDLSNQFITYSIITGTGVLVIAGVNEKKDK